METSARKLTAPALAAFLFSAVGACGGGGAPGPTMDAGPFAPGGDNGPGPSVGDAATPGSTDDAGPSPGSDGGTTIFAYPRGCWSQWSVTSGPIDQAILDNPGLVGIGLAAEWREIESAGDNVFDWSGFDARITEAKAKGLKILLGVTASAAKAPQWLYDDPAVQTLQIIDPNSNHGTGMITVAPFWDPIFHAQKLELITAFGARYGNDPDVVGFMVGFANYYTNDWGIPTDFLSAGYDYDKMIEVGKDVLSTAATAFPNQAIKLPLGQNDPSMDPGKTTTQMADDILAFAASSSFVDRFFAQKNLINTKSIYATDPSLNLADPNSNNYLLKVLRDLSPHMGLQMVASATGGPADGCRQNGHVTPCDDVVAVMAKSIDISLSYKPTYLEFWTADGKNPDLYQGFVDATAAMKAF